MSSENDACIFWGQNNIYRSFYPTSWHCGDRWRSPRAEFWQLHWSWACIWRVRRNVVKNEDLKPNLLFAIIICVFCSWLHHRVIELSERPKMMSTNRLRSDTVIFKWTTDLSYWVHRYMEAIRRNATRQGKLCLKKKRRRIKGNVTIEQVQNSFTALGVKSFVPKNYDSNGSMVLWRDKESGGENETGRWSRKEWKIKVSSVAEDGKLNGERETNASSGSPVTHVTISTHSTSPSVLPFGGWMPR